jgi:hypothetical protein
VVHLETLLRLLWSSRVASPSCAPCGWRWRCTVLSDDPITQITVHPVTTHRPANQQKHTEDQLEQQQIHCAGSSSRGCSRKRGTSEGKSTNLQRLSRSLKSEPVSIDPSDSRRSSHTKQYMSSTRRQILATQHGIQQTNKKHVVHVKGDPTDSTRSSKTKKYMSST